MNNKIESHVCDFCQAEESQDNPFLSSNNRKICSNCVKSAYLLMYDEGLVDSVSASSKVDEEVKDEITGETLLTPDELKLKLDEHVIGQDEAKKVLSVAVYNHYKRLFKANKGAGPKISKSNVLVIGPTGSGKTLLAQTLAEILHVPFIIADATSLTQAGYVGDDVESILTRLYQDAGMDIAKAERGIIFIDEIDKIAKVSAGRSVTRDVGGEGVQQALLKIIEGSKVSFPMDGGRKAPNKENPMIDTSNILFIVGGSFDGLDKIIQARLKKGKQIGFKIEKHGNQEDLSIKELDKIKEETLQTLRKVMTEDLIEFGFLQEFLGRLPVRTVLKELSRTELRATIEEPKNSILDQFKFLMQLDDIEFDFETEAIEKIVDIALARKVGARGVRSIMEEKMYDITYRVKEYRGKKIVLTAQYIDDGVGLLVTDGNKFETKNSSETTEEKKA